MATTLNRMTFKSSYKSYQQGLFILLSEKRLPKDQPTVNIGVELSEKMLSIPLSERTDIVPKILTDIVVSHKAVSLVHLDVLFTEYFNLDVVRALLSLCRNRKICIHWPGRIIDGRLVYATPDRLEYYECDPQSLQDTYIIQE